MHSTFRLAVLSSIASFFMLLDLQLLVEGESVLLIKCHRKVVDVFDWRLAPVQYGKLDGLYAGSASRWLS